MIKYATLNDLEELDQLAVKVITHMKQSKIPQWTLKYPRKEHFLKDIERNALIIYKEQDMIRGCMAVLEENDPPYKTIDSWIKEHSIVIHRVLIDPDTQKQGIAQQLLEYTIINGRKDGYESIKIDTHLENYKMRAFLKKNGFIEGDYIEVMDRIAYEKILEDK